MLINVQKEDLDSFHLTVKATQDEYRREYERAKGYFITLDSGAREWPEEMLASAAREALAFQAISERIPYNYYVKEIIHQGTKDDGAVLLAIEGIRKPTYELSSYEPVTIDPSRITVIERNADDEIARIVEETATYLDEETRPIEANDTCYISLIARTDGKIVPGLTVEPRIYSLGKGYMPDEFDAEIIGMTPGESKCFTIDMPERNPLGYTDMVPTDFDVTVAKLMRKDVPAVDDAWVTERFPIFDSLEALRSALDESLAAQAAQQRDFQRSRLAVEELSTRMHGFLSDEIFEIGLKNQYDNLHRALEAQGTTYEKFVQESGGEQAIQTQLMLQTKQELKEGLSLDALYHHLKLETEDCDLLSVANSISPTHPEQVLTYLEDTGRRATLKEAAERLVATRWLTETLTEVVRG